MRRSYRASEPFSLTAVRKCTDARESKGDGSTEGGRQPDNDDRSVSRPPPRYHRGASFPIVMAQPRSRSVRDKRRHPSRSHFLAARSPWAGTEGIRAARRVQKRSGDEHEERIKHRRETQQENKWRDQAWSTTAPRLLLLLPDRECVRVVRDEWCTRDSSVAAATQTPDQPPCATRSRWPPRPPTVHERREGHDTRGSNCEGRAKDREGRNQKQDQQQHQLTRIPLRLSC